MPFEVTGETSPTEIADMIGKELLGAGETPASNSAPSADSDIPAAPKPAASATSPNAGGERTEPDPTAAKPQDAPAKNPPQAPTADPANANPAAPVTPPVTVEPLPKSWKKETAPLWEKADPALRAYVLTREADMMRGIQQYQGGYQAWGTLMQPFQNSPLSQHPPEVSIQLMQNLARNHLSMLDPRMPKENKIAFARQLAQEYGIDLREAVGDPAAQGESNPEVVQLRQTVQQLQQQLQGFGQQFQTQQEAAQQQALAAKTAEVESFFSDPKNEYAAELVDDIHRLLATGAASTLSEAYESACYLNPTVRAKVLAKLTPVNNTPTPPKPTPPNIQDSGAARPRLPNSKPASWQDGVDEIVAGHYNTH